MTLEAGFDAAKGMGALPDDNPLMNQKPGTLPLCDAAIAVYGLNGQIDTKAGTLKDLQDFSAWAPMEVCRQLDDMIQGLTTGNSHIIPQTQDDQRALIEDIKAPGPSLGQLA